MVKVLNLIIIVIMMTGCGNMMNDLGVMKVREIPKVEDDPFFAQMKTNFYNEMQKRSGQDLRGLDVPIIFGDIRDERNIVGLCHIFRSSGDVLYKYIEIDRNYFSQIPELEKEALLFHELGHCVLDRDHYTERTEAMQPISVMYPYALTYSMYAPRRSSYLNELIQNSFVMGFSYRGKISAIEGSSLQESADIPDDGEIYDHRIQMRVSPHGVHLPEISEIIKL